MVLVCIATLQFVIGDYVLPFWLVQEHRGLVLDDILMSKLPKGWRSPIPEAETLRTILRLMARQTSREIVRVLAKQPSDVRALAQAINRPVSTVRANVNRLADGHIIQAAQSKPKRVYRLSEGVTVDDGPKMLGVTIKTPKGSSISYSLLHKSD